MSKIVNVNEDYLAEYYSKRIQYNKLKNEVDEMSANIKLNLASRALLGNTYGKYTASIVVKNKLNSSFIHLLKENNMQDRIVETCYAKDCKDIISTFTREDEKKYLDEWYKQLIVAKK